MQHDGHNAGQHEYIFEDRDHTGCEHLVQCVHIGGNASHQASNWIFVVKTNVHALQVSEDLAAQIEHHLLPGPLHEVGLQELQQETEGQQAHIERGNLGNADQRLIAEEPVKR